MHEATRFTQHRTLLKAVTDDAEFKSAAVLSLPIADLANDIVLPDGLDFARHQADPWVDLEHGFEPGVGRQPVGWARKSLALPGEPYSVKKSLLEVPGVGKALLPVGVTYFDRDHALQRQVYFLVKKGALPGVSLEFRPVDGFTKSRGPSPLERRDAYEFAKAEVVRWTHCVEPVCPGALTVLKSLPPELDALARILRDAKVEGESLHPHIVKSLARYKPTAVLVSLATTVPTTTPATVGKAMPDATLDTPQTVYDPDAVADPGDGDGGPANNGVSALFAHAQAVADACEQLEADLEHTDSAELYREAVKLCEQSRALAEKFKAAGDKHDAKLQAIKNGKSEPADKPEGEEDEPDMETDDEGTFKAVRKPYRVVLKSVRGVKAYSLAEVQKGIALAEQANRPETNEEKAARLEREDPAAFARVQQKAARLQKLKAI